MNLVASYGVRPTLKASSRIRPKIEVATIASISITRTKPRGICPGCRHWPCSPGEVSRAAQSNNRSWKRCLSTPSRLLEESRKLTTPISTSSPTREQEATRLADGSSVDHASLPSKTDERRWQMSKRTSRMMDQLLARASIAGQHINVYTGTDYSGVERLKEEIIEQERKVRDCHKRVDSARSTHHEAHAEQGSSQKEIVGLLERKSSWSPEDLERYMSLVRSEHTNEQAVQAANEGLSVAEGNLEDARSLLERLERKQYHEEQIWSDTIRRNSTWVTFGLMGLNIILLLAQIAIFEPYRRRKIVKEVRRALDEQTTSSAEVARRIDEVMQPTSDPAEAVEIFEQLGESQAQQPPDAIVPETAAAAEDLLQEPIQVAISPQSAKILPPAPDASPGRWEVYIQSFQDLFSERIVQLKKVDVTTTALQGAATGVAAMGLLFVLFRPR